MTNPDEERLLASVDWTPFSDTAYWVQRCLEDTAELSNLLGWVWSQAEWFQDELMDGDQVDIDVDRLFHFADIICRWAMETNRISRTAIDPQPLMDFAFMARRLSGTKPSSLSAELALHSIDGLLGFLWFALQSFYPVQKTEQPECSSPTESDIPARKHGHWMSAHPPEGDAWTQQLDSPLEGTQEEILNAWRIDRKTLVRRISDGEAYAIFLGKNQKRKNVIRLWIRDIRDHCETLQALLHNKAREARKRE